MNEEGQDPRYPYQFELPGSSKIKVDVGPLIKNQQAQIELLQAELHELKIVARSANLYFWLAVIVLTIDALIFLSGCVLILLGSVTATSLAEAILRAIAH